MNHCMLYIRNGYIIGICRLRLNLAKAYAQVHDHENALSQLELALNAAKESGQQYQIHDIYQELSNLYKSMSVFDKALEYHEKFHEARKPSSISMPRKIEKPQK